MKIALYLNRFPAYGGIEVVTATLANRFALDGHTVFILSHLQGQASGLLTSIADCVRHVLMPDSRYTGKTNKRFLSDFLKENMIDVFIFQDDYSRLEMNFPAEKGRTKIIVVEHNAPFCGMSRWVRYPDTIIGKLKLVRHVAKYYVQLWQDRVRRRRLYEYTDAYVLLSHRFDGEFRAMTDLYDTRKLFSIPNPCVFESFEGGFEKKEKVVVFAGTLSSNKGLLRLLDAWSMIEEGFPDWKLVVLGDGECRMEAEQLIAERSLGNVRLMGYQPNPGEYFAQAEIFAFPSGREGWGLVLVEAMLHGCVPVAFDSYAALRDIVTDGEDGLIAPAFDIKAYSRKLQLLMSDSALREKMSDKARASARRFDVQKVIAKWYNLFDQLTKGDSV